MNLKPGTSAVALALAAALSAAASLPVRAAYPERPITVIVGFPAGGGTDLIVRGMQRGLEKALGTQIVVKNVPGAGASIAAAEAADAKPDGYTLLGISNALVIQPHRAKVPYDPLAFVPVCLVADTPLVLITTKTSPFKSTADIMAAAKADPGKVPYATPGAGSALHLGMVAFDHRLGLKMKHIPFKGTSEMVQAMMSGTLHIATGQPNSIEQYDLVPLAVLAERRIPGFEQVPTAKEATGTEVISSIWTGLLLPPKAERALVEKLEPACKSAMSDADTVAHFEKQKQPITYRGADAFRDLIAKDNDRTREVLEAAGLKAR